MKIKENGLDFKFINITIYGAAFIGLYFFLKNIGIMDKILSGIAALAPVFVGIIICWISMPLVRRLRKIGLSKNLAAFLSLLVRTKISTWLEAFMLSSTVTSKVFFIWL